MVIIRVNRIRTVHRRMIPQSRDVVPRARIPALLADKRELPDQRPDSDEQKQNDAMHRIAGQHDNLGGVRVPEPSLTVPGILASTCYRWLPLSQSRIFFGDTTPWPIRFCSLVVRPCPRRKFVTGSQLKRQGPFLNVKQIARHFKDLCQFRKGICGFHEQLRIPQVVGGKLVAIVTLNPAAQPCAKRFIKQDSLVDA